MAALTFDAVSELLWQRSIVLTIFVFLIVVFCLENKYHDNNRPTGFTKAWVSTVMMDSDDILGGTCCN